MAKLRTVQDVRHAREMLEFEIEAFLRSKGWTHICDTPGSFWAWEREIDGRRVLVDKELALSMQSHLEA